MRFTSVFLIGLGLFAGQFGYGNERTSETDPVLKQYLKQNPDADTDKDGILSSWEKDQHLPKQALASFVKGSRHQHVDIPMRDGCKIAGELFLPPGDGPFPVVLCRAGYGRWLAVRYGKTYNNKGCAYLATDLRQFENGKYACFKDPESSMNELNDCYDTIDWIVKQKWANGKVGTVGGSGNGFASTMGFWGNHPNYTACGAGNTAGNLQLYWAFHNGYARKEYYWLGHRGVKCRRTHPILPTTTFSPDAWKKLIAGKVAENKTYYFNSTGWFDPLVQGALDDFTALQKTGRAFVTIAPRGHGGTSGFGQANLKFPNRAKTPYPKMPSLEKLIKGEDKGGYQSTLKYFLMGDIKDDKAPGNIWKVTHVWPVPHEPTKYYLGSDGSLTAGKAKAEGKCSYQYNPNDPAPSLGGHYTWSSKVSGPHDQKALRKRKDVLYFVTEPLKEPVTITGPVKAQLSISSSAEDTGFIVKLVDIYPDGYEALIRESAVMGRYHSGYGKPSKLEPGKVYTLDVDMWSTAIAFNKGHRIGLIVTSSSSPAYRVHPNTYDPITDLKSAKAANNTIHTGKSYLVLPVVK